MTTAGAAAGAAADAVRPVLRRALVASVALLLVVGVAAPVLAQFVEPRRAGQDVGASLSLDLLAMDGVVEPDGALRLQVAVRNSGRIDRDDLRILATVHRRTIGRFELQQAMGGGELGSIVHPIITDLQTIPRQGARAITITQTAEEMGLDRPGAENVYPLRLQLLTAGEVVDEITTSMVVAPAEAALPLHVAVLVPLGLPPARDAEGVVADEAVLNGLAEGGLLRGSAAVLDANPDLPLTVALDGHTLADIGELANGYTVREDGAVSIRSAESPLAERAREVLTTLSAVGERRSGPQPLALPYAQADLVALVRNGLATEVARHVIDGAAVVGTVTDTPPSPRIHLAADGLDAPTLAELRAIGVDTLVLPEDALVVGNGDDRSPSPVRRLRIPGPPVTVLVPDPGLSEPLAGGSSDGPAVAAQRILSEIASVYLEIPGTANRGLLLAPPPGEHIPPELLATLAGPLVDASFIRPSPLAQLEGQVARSTESVALDYGGRAEELPSTYGVMLSTARRALGSLARVLETDSTLPTRLDTLLLQASSVHYRGEALPEGRDLLRAVSGTVGRIYGGVDVLESPPVTLTAVEGQLPVTVRSTADVPLRVQVSLETARYSVVGGPSREVVLQPDRSEILTFRVRALTPGGTSPIQVSVRDLDGQLDLAQGTVVVRSTAFSVAGAIATAGAALVLLLFAIRPVLKRRQARRGDGDQPPVDEAAVELPPTATTQR